jgi:hypothetical protein
MYIQVKEKINMENTKKCSKCKEIKELSEFYKNGKNKDGFDYNCKKCVKKYRKEYYKNNPEKVKETNKKYVENNREKVLNRKRNYNKKNNHKYKEYWRNYRGENLEHIRENKRKWQRKKTKEDIQYKIRMNLKSRLNSAIKNGNKAGSAVDDLGCTINEFMNYMRTKFTKEMSWDNWGEIWHIDHIKPLVSFDLENREEFLKACHYTNTQPLLVFDNLSKGAKYDKK